MPKKHDNSLKRADDYDGRNTIYGGDAKTQKEADEDAAWLAGNQDEEDNGWGKEDFGDNNRADDDAYAAQRNRVKGPKAERVREPYTGRAYKEGDKGARVAPALADGYNACVRAFRDRKYESYSLEKVKLSIKVQFSSYARSDTRGVTVKPALADVVDFAEEEYLMGRYSSRNAYWTPGFVNERRKVLGKVYTKIPKGAQNRAGTGIAGKHFTPIRTKGGSSCWDDCNAMDRHIRVINNMARVDNQRANAIVAGAKRDMYRETKLQMARMASISAQALVLILENFEDEYATVRWGWRSYSWACGFKDHDQFENEALLVRYERTRGGSVAACPKKGCATEHYHQVATQAKQPSFGEVKKRISEKVKLCKPSQLALCPYGATCESMYPDAVHYHMDAAQKINASHTKLRGSAVIASNDDSYAGYLREDDDGPTIVPQVERAKTPEWSNAENRKFINHTWGMSNKDNRALNRVLGLKQTEHMLICSDNSIMINQPLGPTYTSPKPTSGKDNQCFYTAIAQGDYDVGQKLKRAIDRWPTISDKLRAAFFGDASDARGGDELCPLACQVLDRSIVVHSDDRAHIFLGPDKLFENAIHIRHISGGAGHYETCSTSLVGNILAYCQAESKLAQELMDERAAEENKLLQEHLATPLPEETQEGTLQPPVVDAPKTINNVPVNSEFVLEAPARLPTVLHTPKGVTPVPDSTGGQPQPLGGILVDCGGWVRVTYGTSEYAYYKRKVSIRDGNEFTTYVKYCSVLREVGGEILDLSKYEVLPAGTVTYVRPTSTPWGHYHRLDPLHGGMKTQLLGPVMEIRDAVVQAKEHTWFRGFRQSAMNIAHVMSLGAYYGPDELYRGLTKVRRTIYPSYEVLAYLNLHKLNATVANMQLRHIMTPIIAAHPGVPVEIIVDTAIRFNEVRVMYQSQIKATIPAQVNYLAGDGLHKLGHVEPSQSDTVVNILQGSAPGGLYPLGAPGEADAAHAKGLTCVTRKEFVTSSDSHGSADQPTYPDANKYYQVSASDGCGLRGAYPYFRTQYLEREPGYRSVGFSFASRGQVVKSDPLEACRAALRMTLGRPGEFTLRAAQLSVCAYAYGQRFAKHHVAYDELTHRCRKVDKRYKPQVPTVIVAPTDDQILVDRYYAAHEQAPIPESAWVVQGEQTNKLMEYIEYMGVKTHQRYTALADHDDDIDGVDKGEKTNSGQQKMCETQKVKPAATTNADGTPGPSTMVLKYARLVIGLTGKPWVKADPLRAKQIKNITEIPLIIANNELTMGEYRENLELAQPARDCWVRAVLTDTSLTEACEVITLLDGWLRDHPCGGAAIVHGDDQLYFRLVDGNLRCTESDIVLNDGSHTDTLFRLAASVDLSHGYPIAETYSQLARPIELVNPANRKEKVVICATTGMNQASGHIGTTGTNSLASKLLAVLTIQHCLDEGYVKSAERLGFLVDPTKDDVPLEEGTFISRVITTDDDGQYRMFSDPASLLRNWGEKDGDFEGKGTRHIADRWVDHVEGVVKGMINEPESRLLRQLRRLCGLCHGTDAHRWIDDAYIRRYYADDADNGRTEYDDFIGTLDKIKCVRDMYNHILVHGFVDRLMKKRYGMSPVGVSGG